MGGGGGGGKNSSLIDKLSTAWESKTDLPTDAAGLSQNMMERGRPAFNFSKMGAIQPLAGQIAQPAYSTPPPQFNKDFWMNWEKGDAVDGSNYKASMDKPDFEKIIEGRSKK